MSEKINRLAAELADIRAEIVELESVEEPTDEQADRAETLLAEWDVKKAEHDRLVERAEKVAAVRAAALDPRNVERAVPEAPAVVVKRSPFDDMDAVARGFVPASDMVARAVTAIDEHTVRGVSDASKQRATELAERNPGIARHILLTGSRAYFEAFEQVLRFGPEVGMAMLTDEQRHAMRAALSNTDANGGYTNPWMVDPTVILTNDGVAGPIRSISRVEVGTTELWNGITSAGVTAEWLAEGSEAADKSPTVGQPSIASVKGAAYILSSYEQEADGQLISQLPRLIADAKSRLEEAAFATGSGSGEPKGIVTAVTAVTASRVSPTTGGAFSAATEVYKVANAVPPRHASLSSWIANKTTINAIRQFDVYGGGAFLANLQMGQPPLLLGQPLYECSTMTATVTTGSNILLAGDFSEYLIYDRVGTQMRYVPVVIGSSGQRPTGQAGWFAFWRTGADALNTNAFRVLKL